MKSSWKFLLKLDSKNGGWNGNRSFAQTSKPNPVNAGNNVREGISNTSFPKFNLKNHFVQQPTTKYSPSSKPKKKFQNPLELEKSLEKFAKLKRPNRSRYNLILDL